MSQRQLFTAPATPKICAADGCTSDISQMRVGSKFCSARCRGRAYRSQTPTNATERFSAWPAQWWPPAVTVPWALLAIVAGVELARLG